MRDVPLTRLVIPGMTFNAGEIMMLIRYGILVTAQAAGSAVGRVLFHGLVRGTVGFRLLLAASPNKGERKKDDENVFCFF